MRLVHEYTGKFCQEMRLRSSPVAGFAVISSYLSSIQVFVGWGKERSCMSPLAESTLSSVKGTLYCSYAPMITRFDAPLELIEHDGHGSGQLAVGIF